MPTVIRCGDTVIRTNSGFDEVTSRVQEALECGHTLFAVDDIENDEFEVFVVARKVISLGLEED